MKTFFFSLNGLLFLFVIAAHIAGSVETQTIQYTESDAVLANPLKGWVVWGEDPFSPPQPTTLFFSYRSWRDLEPEEGKFDFESWEEDVWDHWVSKGMKVIFRVYVDYPGRPVGLPQWLIDAGVDMRRYEQYGGGWSPNYEHPLFLEKVKILISKLGERYDQDPRVAFLDVGILGHWGEWHTYPSENLFASLRVQKEITKAFSSAFTHKKMMLRYPTQWSAKEPFGYRDDCFYEDTDGPELWYFFQRLKSAGATQIWRSQPIGGEFCNGGQGAIDATLDDPEKCLRLVREGHFSHLGPAGGAIQSKNAEHQETVDTMLRLMGYRFMIQDATVPISLDAGESADIQIKIANNGSSPFYYPWTVKLLWLDSQNRVITAHDTSLDITKWLPGSHTFSMPITAPKIETSQELKLAIAIPDPDGQGPGIQFANVGEVEDEGFVLGKVQISGNTELGNWEKY